MAAHAGHQGHQAGIREVLVRSLKKQVQSYSFPCPTHSGLQTALPPGREHMIIIV
jgi:hypothetical protein